MIHLKPYVCTTNSVNGHMLNSQQRLLLFPQCTTMQEVTLHEEQHPHESIRFLHPARSLHPHQRRTSGSNEQRSERSASLSGSALGRHAGTYVSSTAIICNIIHDVIAILYLFVLFYFLFFDYFVLWGISLSKNT